MGAEVERGADRDAEDERDQSAGNAGGDSSSDLPSISGDGSKVAFRSFAQNLLPAGGPTVAGTGDVFVRFWQGASPFTGLVSISADGTTGDRFIALVARGNKLSYADRNGAKVTLSLSHGGVMDLLRSADGSVQSLTLINTNPGKSVLTGTVSPKGTQTEIEAILGDTTGVNILLPQAQFKVDSITPAT